MPLWAAHYTPVLIREPLISMSHTSFNQQYVTIASTCKFKLAKKIEPSNP